VDAVLEAAAQILRRRGVAAITTNAVAARAGISVGTLYGYFSDKTEILQALARRLLAEDRVALRAAVERDQSGAPLRAVLRALIARHGKDRALRRAVMGVHLGAGGAREHADQVDRVVAMLVERTEHLGGPLPDDRLRWFVITRAALGVARALVEETEPGDLEEETLVDELTRLIEGYLRQVS
jgi:AcrR family transcriptional regulator